MIGNIFAAITQSFNAGQHPPPPPMGAAKPNASRMSTNTPSLGSRHISVQYPMTSSQNQTYVSPPPPTTGTQGFGSEGYSSMPPPPSTGSTPGGYYDNGPSSAPTPPPPSNNYSGPQSPNDSGANSTFPPQGLYIPVQYHWCYATDTASNIWHAFSMADSIKIDEVFKQGCKWILEEVLDVML